jgi:hypothetical protein
LTGQSILSKDVEARDNPGHDGAGRTDVAEGEDRMTTEYTVGLRLGNRSDAIAIEAEDALIAVQCFDYDKTAV